jgi:hypothetical protein
MHKEESSPYNGDKVPSFLALFDSLGTILPDALR